MTVTIVVGGQYGSEGKGKVVALLARSRAVDCVVRCGGPNSGHTTNVGGTDRVLRQLPSSVGVSDSLIAMAAGAVVDEQVLLQEIKECGVDRSRLIIDPRAIVISDDDRTSEAHLVKEIASTGSGNGQALARRMMRSNASLVEHATNLQQYARIEPVAPLLHEMILRGQDIILEGTQGFGLSLLHGPTYPYVTSKDTTASAFAMEAGISPRDVNHIVLVVRTYPIRVGGQSGPLDGEITWQKVQEDSGADSVEKEFTSVTNNLRRVAPFDMELVRQACRYNKPNSLAVMGLDRLDIRNRHATSASELTPEGTAFLMKIETELGVPIQWVGTGFGTFDAFNCGAHQKQEVSHG